MKHRPMNLMDVLSPPGNDWLKQLAKRKSDLPTGVRIVRFGDGDEDGLRDEAVASSGVQGRHSVSA